MLKLKKIKLSGFRGILKPQELVFSRKGESKPSSFVLYGLNSSGKTSFVDASEWFLSPQNEIEWLKREDAKEKAYPHQEAKDGESLVEIEFYDSDKKVETLTKTFNYKKITQPKLSSEKDFMEIYKSFVIKPYLRYLEVVDFVLNRTGLEKYQKLASWMGFENELTFQEKISIGIVPELKRKKKSLSENVEFLRKNLGKLIGVSIANETTVLNFCNNILKSYEKPESHSISDVWKQISEISKLKKSSPVGLKVDKLTEIETSLSTITFHSDVIRKIEKVQESISNLTKEKQTIDKIDIIDLYTQALEVLNRTTGNKVSCPICGIEWEREKLLEHIRTEFSLLRKLKEEKDNILTSIRDIKDTLRQEQEEVKSVISKYENTKKIIPHLTHEEISKYQINLKDQGTALDDNVFTNNVKCLIQQEGINKINSEKQGITKIINSEKTKIQPSKEELKLSEDLEKLKQIKDKWQTISEAENELIFFSKEVEKLFEVANELIKLIQENIKNRFHEISERICKYFGILRSDKDIKDIKIILKEEKGRATGRSAEIQLIYYNISVKPAYKVLSESLLNSLGLAVYFTCVKQFNDKCKFIVLDDIMNSLDIENRDTVLDLIEQEFKDYQVILFTHDYFWFQKIKRRFPNWISKKIKNWDYKIGATIDFAKSKQEEIEELLKDSTKTEEAGFQFGRHVEGILNEICENIHAEIRHRYIKSDPPSMEELFDSLYKRLKKKIGKHPIVEKVLNVKKYEPLIRNFTGHPSGKFSSTISPTEVRRAIQEWYDLEKELWCSNCRHYVEYFETKDIIECHCHKIKLLNK